MPVSAANTSVLGAGNGRTPAHVPRPPWWLAGPLLALLVAFVVHLIHANWPWPVPAGGSVLARTLAAESDLLGTILGEDGIRLAQTLVRHSHDLAFRRTGLSDILLGYGSSAQQRDAYGHMAAASLTPWHATLSAAFYSLQILSLRTTTILLCLLPLLAMAVAATADGLVARYLRTRLYGRESGYIYHRVKRLLQVSWTLLWAVYLVPWVPMDPRLAVAPFLLVLAVSLRVAVAWFKKHL